MEYPLKHIYLDHNASTPIAADVAAAMRPFLEADWGNPSSTHWSGRPARAAVDRAREQVATLVGATPSEILFTSGGSEASNHAIKGVWFSRMDTRAHFITTAVEHPATLKPLRFLERLGATVTILPVDSTARVNARDVAEALRPETALVSVMHAQNEVGTLEPIAEIGAICREHGALFHVDAAQSLGKVPVHVDHLGVDLLSIAGHKLYAPKGVGALYIRKGITLEPLVHGAGHEAGRRAGTENVLLDVGLGAACELAGTLLDGDGPGSASEIQRLRDLFERALLDQLGDRVRVQGHPALRLPNTLNVAFVGRIGAEILSAMPEVAAGTGAACHAGQVELSAVLVAMGVTPEVGMGAVRFSLGRGTTEDEIRHVVAQLVGILG